MGWLDKSIEGTMVRAWVKPDPKNQGRAVCLVCPLDHQQNPRTFSIAEGFDSITQHSKTKSHREHMTASQTDPDFQWPVPAHQKSMREGLEDMEKKPGSHQDQEGDAAGRPGAAGHGLVEPRLLRQALRLRCQALPPQLPLRDHQGLEPQVSGLDYWVTLRCVSISRSQIILKINPFRVAQLPLPLLHHLQRSQEEEERKV